MANGSCVRSKTLVDLLLFRAAGQPERLAYEFLPVGRLEPQTLCYGELDLRARAIASTLTEGGHAGSRAILLYRPGLEFITAFFGCLYAGVTPVAAPLPQQKRSLPQLLALIADAQAACLLATGDRIALRAPLLSDTRLAGLKWLNVAAIPGHAAHSWRPPRIDAAGLAYLQYTSGSTQAPRGVMIGHSNVLANLEAISDELHHTPDSAGVSWLPHFHDMGLVYGILAPLHGGFPCTLLSPASFVQEPERWLEVISQRRATHSGGPNFAYELCVRRTTAEQRAALDLRCWQVAFNGAEPVQAGTLERFASAFAPSGFRRSAFHPAYGLAEATLKVSGGPAGQEPVYYALDENELANNRVVPTRSGGRGRTLVSCGSPVPGSEIEIVNPASRLASGPDEVGEIWVRGPHVALGYWNRPEVSQKTFQARMAGTGAGPYLRTGDLGFLRDGRLFISGRWKDTIIIRGRNYNAEMIEILAEQSHAGLRAGCAAAFPIERGGAEHLAIVAEIQEQAAGPAIIDAIRVAVFEGAGIAVLAIVLVPPLHLPRTTSGKIQRRECRERFDAGALPVFLKDELPLSDSRGEDRATRQSPALEGEVLQLVADVMGLPPSSVVVDAPLLALGMDSLTAIRLSHAFETAFGVLVPMAELLQGARIGDLVAAAGLRGRAPVSISPPVSAGRVAEIQPLSRGQRALWFMHKLAAGETPYSIVTAVRIRCRLDRDAFLACCREIVDRHPLLRVNFVPADGQPAACCGSTSKSAVLAEDAPGWDHEQLQEVLQEIGFRPMNLERDPLFLLRLFTHSEDEHTLLVVAHHTVADAWSLTIVLDELTRLYESGHVAPPVPLARLTTRFSDYVQWQEKMLAGEEGEAHWRYWSDLLRGDLPALQLQTDRPRPAVQTFRGASHTLLLERRVAQRLREISLAQGATPFVTLLAAYFVLLHRHTGQDDILVGTPTAGRPRPEFASLVGYFVNPVVVRGNLSGDKSFTGFLGEIRCQVLEAFEHQDYPFATLVERLQPVRESSRSPVFQAAFSLQQSHLESPSALSALALREAGVRVRMRGLDLESLALPRRLAEFDLDLNVAELDGSYLVSLTYNTDLFDSDSARAMLERYAVLLEAVADDCEQPLNRLPILSAADRERLTRWHDTGSAHPIDRPVHQSIEDQARTAPDAPAILFRDQRVTYGDLDSRANRLARVLKDYRVQRGTVVALLYERTPDLIVAMLAVMKAGGVYLPIGPETPEDRIRFMLEESRAQVVMVDRASCRRVPFTGLQNTLASGVRMIKAEARNPIENLDSIPPPDRTLIDHSAYGRRISEAGVKYALFLETSRGCPLHCAYCAMRRSGHRVRSAGHVFEEIEYHYRQHHVRRFAITDDIFNLDRSTSSELLHAIIRNKLKLNLFFPNGLRGDMLTRDYVDLMVEAGTVQLALALESGSERIQKLMLKRLNLTRFEEICHYITTRHPHVVFDLFTMHGFPSETEEEAWSTFEFLRRLHWVHFPAVNLLKIFPGTEMERIAVAQGYDPNLIRGSWNSNYHHVSTLLPFSPRFTREYQSKVFFEYVFLPERLREVLKTQQKVYTEMEMVQRYDSYLPEKIESIADILNYFQVPDFKLRKEDFRQDEPWDIPYTARTVAGRRDPKTRLLALELNQVFTSEDDEHKRYNVPETPLGLLYVITYMNQHLGSRLDCRILKSAFDFDSFAELESILRSFRPELIFISCMSFFRDFLHETVSLIRQWGWDVPIVVGGPIASFDHDSLLKDRRVNAAVLGEGESTALNIVERFLECGRKAFEPDALAQIPGVVFGAGSRSGDPFPIEGQAPAADRSREVLLVDELTTVIEAKDPSGLKPESSPSDAAYILYTSGSTGRPRGVVVGHDNLASYTQGFIRQFNLSSADVVAQQASQGFDTSVEEIFPVLMRGGQLAILPRETVNDRDLLQQALVADQVTLLSCAPSMLQQFGELPAGRLRVLISGGDVLRREHIPAVRSSVAVYNTYGPTETTVCATYHRCGGSDGELIPIGRPFPGTTVYLLDARGRLVPPGAVGEICIAGPGVARGYLGDLETTERTFVPDPFRPGRKMYRSGDLGRLRRDGSLQFLGRLDRQVKLRGYRIELQEVEAALGRHPLVREAAVRLREIRGGPSLVAWVGLSETAEHDPDATVSATLLSFLKRDLPAYMLPAAIIALPSLPRGASGKVDEKALPAPDGARPELEQPFVRPTSDVERIVAEIWTEVLGVESIGLHDRFFDLGGHSLTATRVIMRIGEVCRVDIPVRVFFETPTIGGLATAIENAIVEKLEALPQEEARL